MLNGLPYIVNGLGGDSDFAFTRSPEAGSQVRFGDNFGAMRIDAFRDAEEFKAQIDELIRTLRATCPAPGTSGPLLPGDPEREAQKERDVHGVPLVAAVLDDLRDIARQTGVPLD